MKRLALTLGLLPAWSAAAQAQIVTANAQVINIAPPGAFWTMKATGTISLPAGHTLGEIKIELGTITAGVFSPRNSAVEQILNPNPPLVNGSANYSHQFMNTALGGRYPFGARHCEAF